MAVRYTSVVVAPRTFFGLLVLFSALAGIVIAIGILVHYSSSSISPRLPDLIVSHPISNSSSSSSSTGTSSSSSSSSSSTSSSIVSSSSSSSSPIISSSSSSPIINCNCTNNGTCLPTGNCSCPAGYLGSTCNQTICETSNPCSRLNNTYCLMDSCASNGFICYCLSGYITPNCSVKAQDVLNQNTLDYTLHTDTADNNMYYTALPQANLKNTNRQLRKLNYTAPDFCASSTVRLLQPEEWYASYKANGFVPPTPPAGARLQLHVYYIELEFNDTIYHQGRAINDPFWWNPDLFTLNSTGCRTDLGLLNNDWYLNGQPEYQANPAYSALVAVNTSDFYDYARQYWTGTNGVFKTANKYCPKSDPYPRYPIWRDSNSSLFGAFELILNSQTQVFSFLTPPLATASTQFSRNTFQSVYWSWPSNPYSSYYPPNSNWHWSQSTTQSCSLPPHAILVPVSPTVPAEHILLLAQHMLPMPNDIIPNKFAIALLGDGSLDASAFVLKFKTPVTYDKWSSCASLDQGVDPHYEAGSVIPAFVNLLNDTLSSYMPTPDPLGMNPADALARFTPGPYFDDPPDGLAQGFPDQNDPGGLGSAYQLFFYPDQFINTFGTQTGDVCWSISGGGDWTSCTSGSGGTCKCISRGSGVDMCLTGACRYPNNEPNRQPGTYPWELDTDGQPLLNPDGSCIPDPSYNPSNSQNPPRVDTPNWDPCNYFGWPINDRYLWNNQPLQQYNPCDINRSPYSFDDTFPSGLWDYNLDSATNYYKCAPSGAGTPEFNAVVSVGWCMPNNVIGSARYSLTDSQGNPLQLQLSNFPSSYYPVSVVPAPTCVACNCSNSSGLVCISDGSCV